MGTLLQRLQGDVKDAMKARDSGRVQTLRLFVNALQTEGKNKLRDLDDVEEVLVLQKQKKQRIEAAEAFEQAGHPDRAAEERSQAAVLDTYLPDEMTEQEISQIVRSAITEAGASSPKDMGAVMKLVVPKVAGRADGKVVSTIVQSELRAPSAAS